MDSATVSHFRRPTSSSSSCALRQKPCGNWCENGRSIQGLHSILGTQLLKVSYRYRDNGVGVMATLRIAALHMLRLAGFQPIRAGLQPLMHVLRALLMMVK
jgi:hypothetical protein